MSDWDFSFHNFLDIINPLEHLPIIGTLYLAITGTHIGIPEKIAGAALYGGVCGAISGVADAAFEAVTGEDFGDTILALFHGSPEPIGASHGHACHPTALDSHLGVVGGARDHRCHCFAGVAEATRVVDSDLVQRAISAYQKSIALPALMPQPSS